MLPDPSGRVHATRQRLPRLDTILYAPPPYGAHALDRNYMLPPSVASVPQSETVTPISGCLGSHSADDSALPDDIIRTGSIRPADLPERLQNLCSRKFLRFFRGGSDRKGLFQNHASYNGRASWDTTTEAVAHRDLNAMSIAPPYSEAIAAPIPTANHHGLPNYEMASKTDNSNLADP